MTSEQNLSHLCGQLEWAQAHQSLAFAAAWHRARGLPMPPGEYPWGACVAVEAGHFMNQGLALGLKAACDEKALDHLETHLGQGGHPVVLELSPGADPGLATLLALRGYRVRAFQQVWFRDLEGLTPVATPAGIRMQVDPPEASLWAQVVMAGFQERDSLDPAEAAAFRDTLGVESNHAFLAFVGEEPAAAGALGVQGQVGVLSGTSVLPRFRGRGLQRVLIQARLTLAASLGCRQVCSATLPLTASQTNLERMGFRVAYPKLELERPAP